MLKTAPQKSIKKSAPDKPSEASAPSVQPKLAERLREFFVSPSFGLGLAGAVLLWAAFPPINLPWLAWVAPLPWLWLVRLPQLTGRRPYVALWLCGTIFWLAMLYGVRMAHPALNLGWVVLSAYLGVYLPAFVGLSRIAVQRLGVSIVVAAPVVWVGLEVLRGYLVTGFSIGLLAHTQAELPRVIQIADLAGGYTLSFVIMLVAASLARMLPGVGSLWRSNPVHEAKNATAKDSRPLRAAALQFWPLIPAAIAIALTLAYGTWRLEQEVPGATRKPLKVALIQGSMDTKFLPPEKIPQQIVDTYAHYGRLTDDATARQENLHLVIWPESMFMIPERKIEEPLAPLPGVEKPVEELRQALQASQREFFGVLQGEAGRVNQNTSPDRETQFLFGTNSVTYGGDEPPRSFNAALLADREGKIVGRYYKTHAVMFGEYIPLGDWLPFLYSFVPIGGISVGDGPEAFEVANYKLSPSICFESTVPHLIRGQTIELARRGTPADVLVNLTNDGWFWGSSVLDLHFRCGVFRAVENRKPLIVAANTGIATFVDGNGAIRERGTKRRPEALIAEVQPDGRASPYHTLGDLPGWLCAAACVVLAAAGFRRRRIGQQIIEERANRGSR